MKQQFIGLQHCKCGISWKKDTGFFERKFGMVFYLINSKPATEKILDAGKTVKSKAFEGGASHILWQSNAHYMGYITF